MENDETSLTPAEYRIKMLKNINDVILARFDALRMRGYGNWDYNKEIEVYSIKKLDYPFVCTIITDLDSVDYTFKHGIAICTERQAFIDVLENPCGNIQTLLEALGDYYYTHNKSFDELKLNDEQNKLLSKYKEDAINYWNY